MALMDYKTDQGWCNRCSNCKFIPSYRIKKSETMYVCPSITEYNFHAYSGSGKLEVGYSINDGHSPISDTTKTIAYRCTLCGACDYTCKVFRKDIDVTENIEELRKECVENGFVYPEHQAIIDSIDQNGNELCKEAEKKIDWTIGLNIKKVSEGQTGEIYLHNGDVNNFTSGFAKRTNSVVRLLLSKGLDLVTSGEEEPTAADKAFDLGFIKEGVRAAEKLADEVKKSGAKMIVTMDAHAFMAFRYYYPRYGVDLGAEVLHITEFLERIYKDGLLKAGSAEKPLKVTYHDPCNLGRRSEPWKGPYEGDKRRRPMELTRTGDLGVYQAPRTLIGAVEGVELVEMDRIKGWSWCCGNGAGVKETAPELLDHTVENRMREAQLTGADVLVTACPLCEQALGAASGMKVTDILDLVTEYFA